MTTAAVATTALLAAVVSALGFTLSNSNEFNATITKMVADFQASDAMKAFRFATTPGSGLLALVYVVKGATMIPQQVVAWVQSWLGNNGVYTQNSFDYSGIPSRGTVPVNNYSVEAAFDVLLNNNSVNDTYKEYVRQLKDYVLSNYTYSGSASPAFLIRCWKGTGIKKSVTFEAFNIKGSFTYSGITFICAANGKTYADLYYSNITKEDTFRIIEYPDPTSFNNVISSNPSFAVNSSYYEVWALPFGISSKNTTGTSSSAGSLPSVDVSFPTKVGALTEVDALNTWLNKQLEVEIEKVTDVIIDGVNTVAGTVEKVLSLPIAIPDADVLNPSDVMSRDQSATQDAANTTDKAKTDAINDASSVIGGGNGVTPALPSGTVSVSTTDLYSLWNPSSSELSQLASFMWSTNFVDSIKKVVSNPMDTIIGLTMVPVVPPQGADAVLKLGLVSTGVTMTRISTQFTKFECGSITIPREWNNYLDYEPYTICHMYLPFVGVVPVRTNEIMNAVLTLTYNIDLLSGACNAMVYVARDGVNVCMYTYGGNLSAPVPITSADFSRLYAGAMSTLANVGAMIATSGASAAFSGAAALSSIGSMRTQVSHSGGVSGNAGLLGGFTPYLFFDKPIPDAPDNYNTLYGKRSNIYTSLASVTGFTRVQDVHVEGFVATDAEKSEIETLLKNGVIL